MIEIRRPSRKECEDVKELIFGFKEFDIENSAFIFDGEKILGAADFKSDGKTALLNNLLVVENQEFLIDGLIKALINIADVRNHDYFAVKKEKREEFYIKIGFEKIQNQMEFDGMKMKESDYLYAKLPEFFQTSCSCDGGKKIELW